MSEFSNDIRNAVKVLRQGGIILYPTDTVWGIGCDATNAEAVAKVFKLKQREDSKALILLVGSAGQLERTVDEIPDVAFDLIEFSERPVTIIYDKAAPGAHIAPNLLAGDGTIAVRMTREAFSRELCRAFGKPLVSTSANISGQKSPEVFAQIAKEIVDGVDYVCQSRQAEQPRGVKPSTLMRLGAGGLFKILRS